MWADQAYVRSRAISQAIPEYCPAVFVLDVVELVLCGSLWFIINVEKLHWVARFTNLNNESPWHGNNLEIIHLLFYTT